MAQESKDVSAVHPTSYSLCTSTTIGRARAPGLALSRRCLRNNQGTPLGATLEKVTAEIREDQQALREVAGVLGVPRNPVKQFVALAAERLGRLNPNGRFRPGYTPLARLIELKRCKWAFPGSACCARS